MRVTLYGKPDCALCDECKALLQPLQAEFAFALDQRNILDDDALYARFRYLIPVVEIEGGALLQPPHTRSALWGALDEARRQEDAHGTTA